MDALELNSPVSPEDLENGFGTFKAEVSREKPQNNLHVLVARSKRVACLHLNKVISDLSESLKMTDIDYCESAVNLLCAIEDKEYDVIFIDYHIEGVELNALLSFIAQQCPSSQVIVTSVPELKTLEERDLFNSRCSQSCHEDFNELDLKEIIS